MKQLKGDLILTSIVTIIIMIVFVFVSLGNTYYEPIEETAEQDIAATMVNAGSETIEKLELPVATSESITKEEEYVSEFPEFVYSKDWDAEESYLLAKIAMCEAGNQDLHTKTLVILTVLNRVWNDSFPDTIEEVIYQRMPNGVYQFSPIGDGSWERNEPTEECWEAVNMVMEMQYDYSSGALYFETCEDPNNWHSRNLEFLFKSDDMRFYKQEDNNAR